VQLFQSAHAFGHVFHSCDGKLRLALGIAHHKHGQVTPQGVALLVDEALVQTIVIELAGQQTVIQIDIGAVIVRVRDVVARQLSQFIGAVAHHLLKARIWLDELSLQVFDNNAQCRMLENTAKAGLALLHGALITLLLGDVNRVSHDAQHFACIVAHNAGTIPHMNEMPVAVLHPVLGAVDWIALRERLLNGLMSALPVVGMHQIDPPLR
jgi:hypothetical protein